MTCIRRTFVLPATLCVALVGVTDFALGSSPRYELVGRASVVDVHSANLISLRLLEDDRVVVVRLLGVGSPHNRQRIRDVDPTVVRYIMNNNLWEISRAYVRSLVTGKVVDVWARKWNPMDEKNRLLAYLVAPAGSPARIDVNAAIIKRGLGFVTRDYVHVTYANYKQLEEEAKSLRRGMWRALPEGRYSSLR